MSSSLPSFLQKNPRILLLVVGLIGVSGCVALTFLPRMEDPRLTPRVARLITVLPGADAERVESLVTEKLERAIREVEEVKELRSFSSSNVSFIAIELNDNVDEVGADNAWSRVRDKAEDARLEMPREAMAPEFQEYDIMASAVILALKWNRDGATELCHPDPAGQAIARQPRRASGDVQDRVVWGSAGGDLGHPGSRCDDGHEPACS